MTNKDNTRYTQSWGGGGGGGGGWDYLIHEKLFQLQWAPIYMVLMTLNGREVNQKLISMETISAWINSK